MMRKSIKIAHIADIHYRDKDYDEVKKCLDSIIKRIHSINPDLVVISGDLFDSKNIELDSRSVRTAVKQLKQLSIAAPVSIVIGTTSHDGKAAKIMRHINSRNAIWVSDKAEQVYLYGKKISTTIPSSITPDIAISQLPSITKQNMDITGGLKQSNNKVDEFIDKVTSKFRTSAEKSKANIHILNGHFQIKGSKISPTQIITGHDIEISKEQLMQSNADLIMLGHIHFHQKIGSNIFYSGSIYRKDFGETDIKGFYIHEISGNKSIDSVFFKTPTRKMLKYDFNFTGKRNIDPEEYNGIILDKIPKKLKNAHVKVSITVYQDEADLINTEEIKEIIIDNRKAERIKMRVLRKPRVNIRAEKLLSLVSFEEKIRELAKIRDEDLDRDIIAKVRMLESFSEDELMERVIKKVS